MIGWILATALGCYLLKLAGLTVPEDVLERPRVTAVAAALPIALLAALAAVQTFSSTDGLTIDARAVGVSAGVVALLLRAPFLVVVAVAAGVAAALRALGIG